MWLCGQPCPGCRRCRKDVEGGGERVCVVKPSSGGFLTCWLGTLGECSAGKIAEQ